MGRYGGEEFLVVLPETKIADAQDLAERVRLAVMGCKKKDGTAVTCSIGVATLNAGEGSLELIPVADDRVYATKEQGRNRVGAQG